jgi:hypothetical protein
MTSASRMAGIGVLSRIVLAALAAVTLAGCASTGIGSSMRDLPNAVELRAVLRASAGQSADQRADLAAPWVQLWTRRQLPSRIEECLRTGSTVSACYAAHPVDSRVFAMSERERFRLYCYYLTSLDRCLSSRGYRIGKIPDRDVFLIEVHDDAPWSPYDGVVVGTRAEWYALSDACPPVPSRIDRKL